jgi:hypothetical protein
MDTFTPCILLAYFGDKLLSLFFFLIWGHPVFLKPDNGVKKVCVSTQRQRLLSIGKIDQSQNKVKVLPTEIVLKFCCQTPFLVHPGVL